jgi:hypothetical protein
VIRKQRITGSSATVNKQERFYQVLGKAGIFLTHMQRSAPRIATNRVFLPRKSAKTAVHSSHVSNRICICEVHVAQLHQKPFEHNRAEREAD